MKYIGIIPARMESKRLPGKPLAKIGEKSMIQRVYEQASRCEGIDEVFVATDSSKIADHVKSFGKVIITSSKPTNGTERVCEAISKTHNNYDYIINIQGDEPFVNNSQINTLISICDGSNKICTLIKKSVDKKEIIKKSVIKVTISNKNYALSFSRNVIPSGNDNSFFYKHIGIYAFKKNIIEKITKLPKSKLEIAESLEQLRWLENDYKIKTAITDQETFGIDTEDDLIKANKMIIS